MKYCYVLLDLPSRDTSTVLGVYTSALAAHYRKDVLNRRLDRYRKQQIKFEVDGESDKAYAHPAPHAYDDLTVLAVPFLTKKGIRNNKMPE